jgi:putative FmdB family regulatory protein
MPFYEYECSNCKFYVEALQKISDEPLRKCPSCKKRTMKRLVSAPVFRLKGGGWYETDFKSESEEKRNIAGKDEAPETKAEEPKKEGAEAVKPEAAKPEAGDKKAAKEADTKASRKTAVAKPVSKAPAKRSKPAPAKRAAKPAAKKKAKRR